MTRKLAEWKATHRVVYRDGRAVDVCEVAFMPGIFCTLQAWEDENGLCDYSTIEGGVLKERVAGDVFEPVDGVIEELDW
jgi:hypothetical protein